MQEFQCWLEALIVTPENKTTPLASNVANANGDGGTHNEYYPAQKLAWKYIVKFNDKLEVDMEGMKTTQATNATKTIDGISIKASDYVKCDFEKLPDRVGASVQVICKWQSTMVEIPLLTNWEQGVIKFGKIDQSTALSSFPGGAGEPLLFDKKASGVGTWWQVTYSVKQQLLGLNCYHKISLKSKLTKECTDCSKRRLGGRGLVEDEVKSGNWGFQLSAGNVGSACTVCGDGE